MGQNKQAEIAFFDQFGDSKNYDVFSDSGYNRILKEFDELVRPQPGERLGDFGCGTAAITHRIYEQFDLNVCGVDISPKMTEYNQKKFPNIEFFSGDIERTEFEPESFDIIVFSGVLHHFPDFRKVAQESYRLLRKSGRIFAFDPHLKNPFMWLYRSERSPISSTVGRTENERLLERSELKEVFLNAGFHKVEVKGVSGIEFQYVESPLARSLLLPYNIIENAIDLSGLGKYIGSFLITCAYKEP